jgi:hypothetical protein
MIELDEPERATGSFVCIACQKRVDDLLAVWKATPSDWKPGGRIRALKKVGVSIGVIAVAVGASALIDPVGISFVPRIIAVWSMIAIIRTGLEYFKYSGRSSWVYVYRNGVTSLYGKAQWRPNDSSIDAKGRPRLRGIALDERSLTFKLSGLWEDDIVVPVPPAHREQAERVVEELTATVEDTAS